MPSGTLSVLDTLRSTFEAVADFGEDRLYDNLREYYDYHNSQMQFFMDELMGRTTEKELIYGTSDDMEMAPVDEFGRVHAQKIAFGVRVGFPLKPFERTLQWTEEYMENVTVSEFTAQYLGILTADRKRVKNEAMRALFSPTNYDWQDQHVALRVAIPIPVKALVNADGNRVPASPNGTTFDGSTHTHYLGTASLAAADVTALIDTVSEHYTAGTLELAINRSQLATVKTFTTNFNAFPFLGVTPSDNTARALGGRQRNIGNRDMEVGIWDDVPVWVRSWVPANYMVCYVKGAGIPVLMMRVPEGNRAAGGNLRITAEDARHPLHARSYGRKFGVGVYDRTGAAILRTNSSTYASPGIS